MDDLLQRGLRECINNFGSPPRDDILRDKRYFRVPKPLWARMDRADKINTIFRSSDSLFRSGVVVWGHIIQANQLMFEDGSRNCPGELVYSLADVQRVDPHTLASVASDLYSLKGTHPTSPDLAHIAEYLTDEMIRVHGLEVPASISPHVPCRISTTFFVRKHLPFRCLMTPLMPIVVSRSEPHVAMPLPERFWSDTLKEALLLSA